MHTRQISLDFSFSGVSRHSISIILSVLPYFALKVACFLYTKRLNNTHKCADTSSFHLGLGTGPRSLEIMR
jgi:hypothetical protein